MYNVQNHSPADQGLQILGHRALRCDPKLIFWEAPNAREVASHLWLPHIEGNQSIFYWTAPVKTRHNSTTQCKDLFDNEANEEQMRVEAGKQLGKKSTELSREERQMNLAAKSWLPLRRWRDSWIYLVPGGVGGGGVGHLCHPPPSQSGDQGDQWSLTMWTEEDRGRLAQ